MFTVLAGKMEWFDEDDGTETLGENIKYIESFESLVDAMREWEICIGYHFRRIEYKGEILLS